MPFDLFLSRAGSFAELDSAPPVSLDDLGAPPGARAAPDGGFWLEHPGGEPWLAVMQRGPNVVLSTSYSNRRFVRNFVDAFDLAQQLASHVSARVFEEVSGTEVSPSQLDALFSPFGRYVQRQAATFQQTERRIQAEGMARLEYPLGPLDLVGEYFAFGVVGADAATPDAVAAALARGLEARRVHRASSTAFDVRARDTRRTSGRAPDPATKVLCRPDGAVQVWPTWAHPFSELASVTLEVARHLATSLDADLVLGGRSVDAAYLAEIAARSSGLGVDFYRWITG